MIGGRPVILKALTAEMDLAFRGPTLTISELPFRIGRECREPVRESRLESASPLGIDRRQGIASPNNELYILESGGRHFVSRQHALLEARDHCLILVDLFSSCGTIVEGRYIGGNNKGGECVLERGSVVILGTSSSPFVFKVL